VLRVGDVFENPKTGATMEIVRVPADGDDGLEVRRLLKPGTGKTIPHVHHDYAERFVVERGEATVKVGGRRAKLRPGEESNVPVRGTHVNAFNDSDSDLVMRHAFEPASAFALGYVETLGHLMRAGRTDRQGEVPVLAAFAIADETDSQTFAAGVPPAVQRRVVAPLGARIAKLRGYELHLPA
jgi:mannose-6-phosphate isomerase-like protein (cupin superfamily)